jgi:hypothetical protein
MSARAWRLLGLLVGLVLLGFVLRRLFADGARLALDWRAVRAPMLAAALAVALAAQLLFASSWHRLLGAREAGGWRHDAARWSVSLAGKYVPGKVFQALLRLGAHRGSDPGAVIAPAFAREMLLSLGAAALLVASLAWLEPSAPAGVVAPLAVLAVLLPLLALPAAARPLRALAQRLPAARGLDAAATPPSRLVQAWLLQLGGYALLGLSVWLLGRGLGPGTSVAPGLAVAALCFGGLAGVAVMLVPAGIGVREAALAWFLAGVLAPAPAALLAIAARLLLTLAEALAMLAGLWRLRADAWRR